MAYLARLSESLDPHVHACKQTHTHARSTHACTHGTKIQLEKKNKTHAHTHTHTHTHTLAHACICIVALIESEDIIGNTETEDTNEHDLFPSPHEGECSLFLVSALVMLTFICYLIR